MPTCGSKNCAMYYFFQKTGLWVHQNTTETWNSAGPEATLDILRSRFPVRWPWDGTVRVKSRHATLSSLCAQTTDTETELEIYFILSWPPLFKVVWTGKEKTKATHKNCPFWAQTYSVTGTHFKHIGCDTSDPVSNACTSRKKSYYYEGFT
jgi:hypothetical protein